MLLVRKGYFSDFSNLMNFYDPCHNKNGDHDQRQGTEIIVMVIIDKKLSEMGLTGRLWEI